jgi:hypothetical protein
MKIHWCYKGIAGHAGFGDAEAENVLTRTGIQSNWLRANAALPSADANILAQDALSPGALDDHVNAYSLVAGNTPYISLSAGCYEYANPYTAPHRIPAIRTALGFATQDGTTNGYIFRLWAVTAPQPAPEVLGVADEIRNIHMFPDFYQFHDEGEIAAKILVPRRHIELVIKVAADGTLLPAAWSGGGTSFVNRDFVAPATIANLIEAL